MNLTFVQTVYRSNYLFNVSSTDSERCKGSVNEALCIDRRLLWKQEIGGNCL